MINNKLDSKLRVIARRFGSGENIDDFEQIGRIIIWELQEKDPSFSDSYLLKAAKNGMINEVKRRKAKKRVPKGGIISLTSPIKLGEDLTLEDIIGEEDVNFDFLESDILIKILKNKYGHFYTNGIKGEKRPREIVRNIIRASIEDVSNIKKKDIPLKVNYKFFVDLGLERLLWVFYKNSPFLAVNDTYNKEFLPWNFKKAPQNIWNGKNGYENVLFAIKWFIKNKNIKTKRDCRYITTNDFIELGLNGMLQAHFNSSPLLALKTQFPDLNEWETTRTPNGFFDTKEKKINSLLSYLLFNNVPSILELTPEYTYELGLRRFVSKDSISKYGLRGLLNNYKNSPYDLFRDIFPKQILPWTLGFSKKVWKDNPLEVASEAIKWLFEQYLKIPQEEILEYATCNLFWNVGFSGILTNRNLGFNSSPYKAIDNAYPGVFSKDDFCKNRIIKRVNTPCLKRSHNS